MVYLLLIQACTLKHHHSYPPIPTPTLVTTILTLSFFSLSLSGYSREISHVSSQIVLRAFKPTLSLQPTPPHLALAHH